MLSLAALVEKNIGELRGNDQTFSGISTDTRTITRGQLFVALKGERFDGHDSVEQAVSSGACAVVVERWVDADIPQLKVENTLLALGKIANLIRQSFSGKVVEVTGSTGKTSVKGFLREICSAAGTCIATQGNLNNFIGVPLTMFRMHEQADFAVIEAGTNKKGEIGYLTSIIDPDVVLVNNVMAAHVEGFGDVDAIAEEKSAIYDSGARESICVVNVDDDYLPVFLEHIGHQKVVAYGKQQKFLSLLPDSQIIAYVSADNEVADHAGYFSFELAIANNKLKVQLKVMGKHNVANALAASACALAMGIEASFIVEGLHSYCGDKGRMQAMEGIAGAALIDDSYNANPGSFKSAIEYLAQYNDSILVCGDMGELGADAIQMHEDVGRYAKNCGVTQLYATGSLAAHMADGFGPSAQFFTEKQDLIDALRNQVTQESVVLVKGSRSAKMEVVVEALRNKEEVQPC